MEGHAGPPVLGFGSGLAIILVVIAAVGGLCYLIF